MYQTHPASVLMWEVSTVLCPVDNLKEYQTLWPKLCFAGVQSSNVGHTQWPYSLYKLPFCMHDLSDTAAMLHRCLQPQNIVFG